MICFIWMICKFFVMKLNEAFNQFSDQLMKVPSSPLA